MAQPIKWEPPTQEEVIAAIRDGVRAGGNDSARMLESLTKFLERRNAALLPKPVDERRKKVLELINTWMADNTSRRTLADRILAALDAKVQP